MSIAVLFGKSYISCPLLSLDSCNSSVHPVQLNALAKNVNLTNDLNTVIRWKEDFVHVQSGHGEVPHCEGLVEHGPWWGAGQGRQGLEKRCFYLDWIEFPDLDDFAWSGFVIFSLLPRFSSWARRLPSMTEPTRWPGVCGRSGATRGLSVRTKLQWTKLHGSPFSYLSVYHRHTDHRDGLLRPCCGSSLQQPEACSRVHDLQLLHASYWSGWIEGSLTYIDAFHKI